MFKITILTCLLPITILSQHKSLDSIIIVGNQSIHKNLITSTKISKEDLNKSASYNVIDDLHNTTNLNLQTRGFHGSQSDIGIRNGNYEQVGILLNGIRLNNPTTGHNNVNFPFTRQSIESIDIVKGGSGKFFGNNSLCGTISFNTSKPKKNELIGDISLGSFSNFSSQLGYNFIGKKSWHRFSTNYLRAADYRPNTDNETIQFFNENHFEVVKDLDIYATVGIHAKKFGANGFYTLRFPNQYEEIQSYFYNLGAKSKNLKLDFYWNQINDYFILRRENPGFYANRHYTDVYGALLNANKQLHKNIKLSGSAEIRKEDLKSNNLGLRTRWQYNLNGNLDIIALKKLTINLGGNLSKIDSFDLFATGGINVSYQLPKNHLIYSSFNSSFRTPSFTELYYTSPTDSGNKLLSPERAYNFELGHKFISNVISFNTALYYRICNNQIDWVKDNSTVNFFRSQNISNIKHYGFEANINFNLKNILQAKPIENFQLSYAHNQFSLDSNQNARYSNTILQNQLIGSLYLRYSEKLTQTISARLEDRPAIGKVFLLLDTKFEYNLYKRMVSLFFIAQNLTNTNYSYIVGLPMPGINFQSGLKFNL